MEKAIHLSQSLIFVCFICCDINKNVAETFGEELMRKLQFSYLLGLYSLQLYFFSILTATLLSVIYRIIQALLNRKH